jgi:hypothetical protein
VINKLTCPACGAEVTLEQLNQAAEVVALAKAQAAWGDDWRLIKEYLDLFKGKHSLKITKLVRLAREVWKMWQAGGFELGQDYYRVGREEFRQALQTTCNQASPGLTNHNYLKKVLVGAAEQTSRRQERELREKEDGLRSTGPRTPGCKPGPPEEDNPEWTAEFLRLNRAVRLARTPEARAEAKAALEQHLAAAAAPEADP